MNAENSQKEEDRGELLVLLYGIAMATHHDLDIKPYAEGNEGKR